MKGKSSFATKHNIAIASLIKHQSNVIEIACNNSELLNFLRENKKINANCAIIKSGKNLENYKNINIKQINLLTDLSSNYNRDFDYAILDNKIHNLENPKKVLREMLEIANYAIISLENFAFIKNRFYFLFKGRIFNENLKIYNKYCTIADFKNLCSELDFSIEKELFMIGGNFFSKNLMTNLFAKKGFFLIKKNEPSLTAQEDFIETKQTLIPNSYQVAFKA